MSLAPVLLLQLFLDITPKSKDVTVYNFDVEDDHSYFVGTHDGGTSERNHMDENSVSPLSHGDGFAIEMDTADHYQTSSWGRSIEAQQYRADQKALIDQGRFDDAIQMDIDDITSRFPGKYDDAILQMIDSL